jgi:hypothetical protein
VRCPACDARNAASAGWCTQCYAPLGQVAAPRAAAIADGDEAPAGDSTRDVPDRDVHDRGARDRDARDRDVRERAGVVEWRCPRCEAWSPLLAPTCVACSGPRQGFGEVVAPGRERLPPPEYLVGASVVLPGAGHLVAGRVGTGAARLLLWLVWLLPGLAIVRGAAGVAALPGIAMLAGAGALWAATLVDAQRLASGDDRELLAARALRWLVGAVLVAVVLAVLLATVASR